MTSLPLSLSLLNKVRRCRSGWMACCPAHEDRSPSLSIKVIYDRVLLHCFAGCSLIAICGALSIRPRDLFFKNDCTDYSTIRQRQQEQVQRKVREKERHRMNGLWIDARREAEGFLQECRGLDISGWSPGKLDRVMNSVCKALSVLREEEGFYESA